MYIWALNVVHKRKYLTDIIDSIWKDRRIGLLSKYLVHYSLSLDSYISYNRRSVQGNRRQSLGEVGKCWLTSLSVNELEGRIQQVMSTNSPTNTLWDYSGAGGYAYMFYMIKEVALSTMQNSSWPSSIWKNSGKNNSWVTLSRPVKFRLSLHRFLQQRYTSELFILCSFRNQWGAIAILRHTSYPKAQFKSGEVCTSFLWYCW